MALSLVVVLMLSLFTPVAKAEAAANTASLVVDTLELMDTDKAISKTVTRAQFAQILVNLSSYRGTTVTNVNVSLYPDVKSTYWASGYIKTAVTDGWMFAKLNGYFKPDSAITLQEAVYGILVILGYSSSDFSGGLSSGVMSMYKQKELDTDISLTKSSSLTKSACTQLLYNALRATKKTGEVYGESFGCTLDSDGEISYLQLVSSNLEGPFVATTSWKDSIPMTISSSTIYRNDKKVTASSITTNDVLYYSEPLNTIWAYSTKVTGTVKKITTTSLVPTDVTIGSTTYTFETESVASNFSIYGSVNSGDIVTVLLGKEGNIAGIIGLTESKLEFAGIIVDVSENGSAMTDSDADYTITVVDASGVELSYDYDDPDDNDNISFEAGDLVQVAVDSEGAEFTELDSANYHTISGTVNAEATKFGTSSFADDVAILDVGGDKHASIYPSRLIGAAIDASYVTYYKKNSAGEITELILNNYTGDCYSYGVVTAASSSGSYTYDIAGTTGTASDVTSSNVQENDPCRIFYSDGAVESISALTMILVNSIDDGIVYAANGKQYKISDDVLYYFDDYSGNAYEYTNLDDLGDLSKYTLSAFYDKTEDQGGRIRVIVVRKKSA